MKIIEFNGQDYLLVGDLESGGPIATREQFENGEVSCAHLQRDGRVMRLGEAIGDRSDIAVKGDTECEMKASPAKMLANFCEAWGW